MESELDLLKAKNQTKMQLESYAFNNFKTSAKDYYDSLNKMQTSEYNMQKKMIEAEITNMNSVKPKNEADKIKIKTDLVKLNSQLATSEIEYKQKIEQNREALESYNRALQRNKDLKGIDNTRNDDLAKLQMQQMDKDKQNAISGKSNGIVS